MRLVSRRLSKNGESPTTKGGSCNASDLHDGTDQGLASDDSISTTAESYGISPTNSVELLEGMRLVSRRLCNKGEPPTTKGGSCNASDLHDGADQGPASDDSISTIAESGGNSPTNSSLPKTEHETPTAVLERPTVVPKVDTCAEDAFVGSDEIISCKAIDDRFSFEDIPERGSVNVGKTEHETVTKLTGSIVIYFRALGRHGETVLDPVLAELLFIRSWRQVDLRLIPSNYPHMRATGELPACFSPDGLVRRPQLLQKLRHWTGCCFSSTTTDSLARAEHAEGRTAPVTDAAWRCFLEQRVGVPLQVLLWCDEAVYAKHTHPALLGTTPRGFGSYLAWSLRRTWRQKLRSCVSVVGNAGLPAIVEELDKSLTMLEERLGNAESFGDEQITCLDACAYGQLSVLYSINCKQGSPLHNLLLQHRSLANFCARMELRLGAWPERRTFLAALEPEDRLPAWQEACKTF